jgi:hypothetical protein
MADREKRDARPAVYGTRGSSAAFGSRGTVPNALQ